MLQPVTKRFVLSRISRLFDPLGIVSPVVLVAKLLMQALWVRKLEWDEPIPEDLLAQCLKLSNSLTSLNQAKISICVIPEECETFEIHGFADASSSAYGACLYLRAVKENGDTCCNLLNSKSRVAPLTEMTIPRKELCAALLLSHLLVKVLSLKADKTSYVQKCLVVQQPNCALVVEKSTVTPGYFCAQPRGRNQSKNPPVSMGIRTVCR